MPDTEPVGKLFERLVLSVIAPAGVIVGSLYIFNSLGDIRYLPASIMAFGVGFFVIYLVFKYWINVDATQGTPKQQTTRFLILFAINVAINTEIVYLLVNFGGVPLLTAQTVAAVTVAYECYYAYRSLLLRNDHMRMVTAPKSTSDDIVYYDADGVRQDNL